MSEDKKRVRVWDNCKHIGEVITSNRTKIVVELVARDGVRYLNVREWYFKKSTEEWKPGLAGSKIPIAIPVDGNITFPCNDLHKLIAAGVNSSRDFEIEDKENAVWYYK
jgi:hypothetical protein